MGWYSGNSNSKTQFVALKQPNAWGLYDMHGNVFEWVNDWYSSGYYAVSPADDPPGPAEGTQKVMRGGSVDRGAVDSRSAERRSGNPASPGFTIYYGFRLARSGAD
jgi:formylglycine-generating enzyme required for sulfatase activity